MRHRTLLVVRDHLGAPVPERHPYPERVIEPSLLADVAAAVGLQEGEPGVRAVLRAIYRNEPVAAGRVSRLTSIPVPIVTAVCGELRSRGVVSRQRPVQLTDEARAQLAFDLTPILGHCATCDGRGVAPDPTLEPLRARFEALEAESPPVRMEIDQVHCTVDTKVLRAAALSDAGALDGTRVLFIGDDDLTSVAIAELLALVGGRGPREVVVVDVDEAIVAFLTERLADAPFAFQAVAYDARSPLPEELAARFDVVFTDPPYTTAGAALFLSRALSALEPGPGRQVFLAFGSPVPDVIRGTQAAIAELGFAVHQLVPAFNEYLGAGVIAGTSHLYHLRTTGDMAPLVGHADRFDGDLYTGDGRGKARQYVCTRCGETYLVGASERWRMIADLKAEGCPRCGNDRFRPSTLVAATPAEAGPAEA